MRRRHRRTHFPAGEKKSEMQRGGIFLPSQKCYRGNANAKINSILDVMERIYLTWHARFSQTGGALRECIAIAPVVPCIHQLTACACVRSAWPGGFSGHCIFLSVACIARRRRRDRSRQFWWLLCCGVRCTRTPQQATAGHTAYNIALFCLMNCFNLHVARL